MSRRRASNVPLVAIGLAVALMALAAARAAEPSLEKDVRPLLEKHCFACHGPVKQEHEVNLSLSRDDSSLARDPELWFRVAEQLESLAMPPEGEPQPSDAEREGLIAALRHRLDRLLAAAPPDPGRVTIRRLNRQEYNNTIRDLVGLDLRPAEDFPLDDSRGGFDNNGEALSLPPILLEKYLDAAERVLDRAIVPDPSVEPLDITIDADALSKSRASGPAVAISPDREAAASLSIATPGRYEACVRAWRSGDAPATMVLTIDGVDLALVRVDSDSPSEHRVTIPIGAGERSLAIRNSRPSAQRSKDAQTEPEATLHVEHLRLTGPEQATAHRRIFFVTPGDETSDDEAARRILERFATRAFRRPVQDEELDRLIGLYAQGRRNEKPFVESVRLGLWSILVSPQFLFRVELDRSGGGQNGVRPLSDWELASRLSYFLWSSMPDDELFELASQGRLQDPAALQAQVHRMLADPKSQALIEGFAGQWLGLQKLETAERDRQLFPGFDGRLRRAMRDEALLFFESILRDDRSALELIDADYTFLNENLARHYGLRDVRGDQMRRVSLSDTNRGGVITMAGVLTITSLPTRTSAVNRGKWILEEILGAPPPPPPPNVPSLDPPGQADAIGELTLRQRLERHRADPQCASCHRRMDALGLGLENFDAVGRWRDQESGKLIDASGALPTGETFRTPAELKSLLARRPDAFARAFTEKMLAYALGRSLTWSDRREVTRIADALAASDYRLSALIEEIVKGHAFRYRRAL
jgi:hypothetical protein